ncbi:MAG: hypothetical protein P9X27_05645 [Candidatus Kaelpia aquatica]|nr:hypothetical protein [Candidatus Kaelpia aquatica]
MQKLQYFDPISIDTPREIVYRRLGSKPEMNIASHQIEEFDGYIQEGRSKMELKGAYLRLPVKRNSSSVVEFENGLSVKSKLLSSLIGNYREALFMAATAGESIMDEIKIAQDDNMTKAVVLDALASESVELSLEWIQRFLNRELLREKKRLIMRRISCGYSDFKIEHQNEIYRLMKLKRLKIKINDYFQLIPEKSVTAVTAIEDIG